MSNLQLINTILYVTENGCKWRTLPETCGNWHTIYVRMNRWSKNGVLSRVFAALQTEEIIQINVDVICLDSTTVKVRSDGTGALTKQKVVEQFKANPNFPAKTMYRIPFVTSGGSDMGKTNESLKQSYIDAVFCEGKAFRPNVSKGELVCWADQF